MDSDILGGLTDDEDELGDGDDGEEGSLFEEEVTLGDDPFADNDIDDDIDDDKAE